MRVITRWSSVASFQPSHLSAAPKLGRFCAASGAVTPRPGDAGDYARRGTDIHRLL